MFLKTTYLLLFLKTTHSSWLTWNQILVTCSNQSPVTINNENLLPPFFCVVKIFLLFQEQIQPGFIIHLGETSERNEVGWGCIGMVWFWQCHQDKP